MYDIKAMRYDIKAMSSSSGKAVRMLLVAMARTVIGATSELGK
jgi:hypothetical protein